MWTEILIAYLILSLLHYLLLLWYREDKVNLITTDGISREIVMLMIALIPLFWIFVWIMIIYGGDKNGMV